MKSPPEYLPGAAPAQRQAADLEIERSRVCAEEESIDLSPNDRPGTRSINPPSSRKRSTPSLFIAEPSAPTRKGPNPFSKIRMNLEQSNQLNSTLSKSMKYYKKEYNKCMTEIHRLNKLVIDNKTPDPIDRDDAVNLNAAGVTSHRLNRNTVNGANTRHFLNKLHW